METPTKRKVTTKLLCISTHKG
eukprot:COSAG01_NODE_74471_length_212_cov_22.654867_1_plen_21_part_10